ncbi:MAG TPA: glycoside hydrolase family 15 protein, partial [Acetobacteraceae bacterium]|nr:glycoside hydrolase family 15 protein [Acetobacteraceae bacterium]
MPSRIEDYAMIGDGRTVALVSRTGALDWLCLPRFDSDPCCAALLGTEDNGRWCISPCGPASTRRGYVDDTLVLQTEFTSDAGSARLTDFMAMGTETPTVIRKLTGISGTMRMRCELSLRFDWGLMPPRIVRQDGALLAIVGPDLVALRAPVHLEQSEPGSMTAEFELPAGAEVNFVLTYGTSHYPPPKPVDAGKAEADTLGFWRGWAATFQSKTPWRDAVLRSLITLKGLIYHPCGGMVAAPTSSLPEMPGGTLNWDYRYSWLRDASFTLGALLNAGYRDEAACWRDWMLRAIAGSPEKMRILYRVDGGRRMDEQKIEWLKGYEGAGPVRVGNSAAAQRQIDVVGELLDALNLIARGGVKETPESLTAERELVEHLERTWQDKGHGLWESRGEPHRYTYSMAMAWVGVDRFLRNNARRGTMDTATLEHLRALRDQIHAEVVELGWNHARGHFVDRYGGERVDASLLLLPLVNFLPADDPRMA